MDTRESGDTIPAGSQVIEVRIAELRQLFNSIDPTPFRDRDLDPGVEEFIVDWSLEVPRHVPLALLVRFDGQAAQGDEAAILRDAVRQHFGRRAAASRRRLKHLFHTGRISAVIGLVVLSACTLLGQFVMRWAGGGNIGSMLRESLLIGGWVAMWRPLQVFLYDWWPIRAEARLYDRLAAMPVRISQTPP